VARFLNDLSVTKLKDGRWEVNADFKYESDIIEGIICVPAGEITNFASVPRLPLAYLLTGNTAHKAAVIHDYLYRVKTIKRKLADKVLKEAMQTSGIWWWRRWLMYSAVRAGGWKAWRV